MHAFLARRPLVGMAMVFVLGDAAGLATGHWQGVAEAWLVVVLVWIFSRYMRQLRPWQSFCTLLLVCVSGWLGAAMALDRRNAELTRLEHCTGARLVMVCGTVQGDVAIVRLGNGSSACRFALRDVEVCDGADTNELCATPFQVTWYGVSGQFGARWFLPATGERWRFHGKLRLSQGLGRTPQATLGTRAKSAQRLTPASLRDWQTLTDRARQFLAQRVTRGIQDWGAMPSLVQAIFLGMRRDVPPELQQLFRDTGIVYAFAIAGLHVAIVASFVIGLLSILGVPRTCWCVPLAPAVFFYTAATGMSASALRASLMAVLYFAAPLLGRRPDKLTTLAAAAMIALGLAPFQLQDIGFCLSFAVMGGLLLLYPPLSRIFKQLLHVDDVTLEDRAARQLGGELSAKAKRWYRWRVWILRNLADLGAVALTAWLSSSPLTAYYFGRLTPGSLLASLPVAPALFGVGIASCAGFLAGLFSPWMETIFNHAAGGLAQALVWVAVGTAALPGCSMTIPRPSEWMVALWYGVLLWLTWGLWRVARPKDAGAAWLTKTHEVDGRAAPACTHKSH